ncbi:MULTISPECIES: hypothetical protein [Gordonia]|uniref:Secreted protein n=1 Tax=Gordonia cholesterolivorans TaxID=559625 RepID=A0ABN3H273_9ACTN|nr:MULTISPECIES: hypothetical protein [Gordonia]KJR07384.1 hypothetical protein UG54_10890 [Gordonia sihwensis]KXT56517.1 hypothetical protein Y710_13625 [Gordonia sp. QH-12]MBY4571590.1 hypothetical protein [Gordonia sihwensis]
MIRRITLLAAVAAVGLTVAFAGAPAASAAPTHAPPPRMYCTGTVCFLICAAIDAISPVPQRWCYPLWTPNMS